MNALTFVMVIFSVLGGFDRMIGNRFGLGREFERGFMLFGNLALSMIGMLVFVPFLADIFAPALQIFYRTFGIDPSIIPALVFANNMGAAGLALEITQDPAIALFNGLVVASMMGFTISFTLPYALSTVSRANHKDMLLGFLCGVAAIPIGCVVSGLMCRIPLGILLMDLLPVLLFSLVIIFALIFFPVIAVTVFDWIGVAIKALITLGAILGLVRFLTGVEILPGLASFESGAAVCLSAMALMTGVFPMIYTVSRLVAKPLQKLRLLAGINQSSVMGFVATVASTITTFEMMDDMDRKGLILNAAFSISAGCVFGGHLAFTMTIDPKYAYPVIAGKLISGLFAIAAAIAVCRRDSRT